MPEAPKLLRKAGQYEFAAHTLALDMANHGAAVVSAFESASFIAP